jgi:esterase/lipase
MAPRLAASGFHVRAMRLPGFAQPVEQYGQYSSDDWIDSVKQEVAALRTTHERVILLSHSLGGAVAIRYLLDHAGEVDAAVFLAPAVQVADNRSPLLPTRVWHRVAGALIFTQIVTSSYSNDAHDPIELDSSHQTRFTPRRVINQTFELIDYNHGRASEIKIPTLMVLTHEDKINDWRASESFYQDLENPLKKIVFNDRAGHPLPFDYGWEEVSDSIIEFIRQVESMNGAE